MTFRRPLVSIVTPSLNQGRFLDQAIRSIQNQDYDPIEHLVADGGSTDGTLEILRGNEHLQWWSAPDSGQSDALNTALARSRGEIIGWLNSDDVYVPSAIRTAVDYLQSRSDVDLVYGNYFVIDQADALVRICRAPRFDYRRLLTLDTIIAQPTVFFRRSLLERTGGLDPALRFTMDFDLWLRAALCGRLARIPRVLAAYRIHPTAKSVCHALDAAGEARRVLDRVFSDPRLPPAWATLRDTAMSAAEIVRGVAAYDAGDHASARAGLSRGLRGYRQPFTGRAIQARLILVEYQTGLPAFSMLRRLRRWALPIACAAGYPLFARRAGAPRQATSWIHATGSDHRPSFIVRDVSGAAAAHSQQTPD